MLQACRVHDETTGIAGPYCTKLLADAGASVTRYEPPGGDPLRRRGTGGLFEFLNAGKAEARAGEADPAAADVYVTGTAPDVTALHTRNPSLVIVTITPFGIDGPWAGRPATEFTLQAAAGSTGGRGRPEEPPIAAGGDLGEWIGGVYAAVGTLAALRVARRHGRGEHVDVALLDAMATTMATFPSVFAEFLGWPELPERSWTIEVPSIEPTSDGYAVFTTNSAQQFSDFMVLIGRADLADDESLARATTRFARRHEFLQLVHEYTTKRTTDEVLAEAALYRIPSAPVLTGETVPAFPHFVERGVFGPGPSGRHLQPRVPYRIEPRPPLDDVGPSPRVAGGPRRPVDGGDLPLAGIRVVDCTAWWAGPAMTHALATLGADVVKVESTRRPDLMRTATTKPPTTDRWWEWGPLFHGVNTNKRAVTLDLTDAEGVALFERLVATADVLVENYTPRVMENFGLGWERLRTLNPRLVMVRMPAFGLDGPWRDRTGFAQTMEAITGMAWLTGYPGGPPTLVRGACDPVAGMHAVVATLVALDERDRTGRGQFVEAPMVEAALNVAAEQVIEHSATGTVLTRHGNRGPGAAPQGVYPCGGGEREQWVAVAVATDEQWRGLRRCLGDPAWARDAALDGATGRRDAHDRVDAALTAWTRDRRAEDVVAALVDAGVPAEVVIPSRDIARNPQLRHRKLFEVEHHPVTGSNEMPVLPLRFASVERWLRRPAPTIGQHNDEILDEIGVGPDERARLRAAGLVGETLVGA